MIRAEFGIIDDFEKFQKQQKYSEYAPEKYHCVAVDDDIYMNDWMAQLYDTDTLNVYSRAVLQPQKSLSRFGITIIPPTSLPAFLNIVISDKQYENDINLTDLAELIRRAIEEEKYMIHYGV